MLRLRDDPRMNDEEGRRFLPSEPRKAYDGNCYLQVIGIEVGTTIKTTAAHPTLFLEFFLQVEPESEPLFATAGPPSTQVEEKGNLKALPTTAC